MKELELLQELGRKLEVSPRPDENIREALMRTLLRIRDKQGNLSRLILNRAQQDYERKCSKKNIVLKARQLGITTYIAARFFLRTITQPGTLTVQVAHDQRAAEQIFRIVYRFLENLPGKSGAEKKEAALSFASSAISMTDAVLAKQIIDPDKFRDGLGKIIDGVVQCLNASAWAKN